MLLKAAMLPLVLLLGLGAINGHAEESSSLTPSAESTPRSRAGTIGLLGSAAYYTYGMEDANARYQGQTNDSFKGGIGYGGGLKVYLSNNLAAKAAVDYLFTSRAASRTIGGIVYNTQVDLPATLVFLGGEFDLIPGGPLNLKLIGGYTLINIYNGKEQSTDSNKLDLGAVTGSGSGFQVGAGIEGFVAPALSLGLNLCYNKARIDGATFAGAPADPNSTTSNGAVDYSGVMAKAVITLYLN
jgi:opacity protein-like surface antigen